MQYQLLNKFILKNKYSISYKNAKKLIEKNKVSVIDIIKKDNKHIIYGRVNVEHKLINIFVKVDEKNIIYKCNCLFYKSQEVYGTRTPCEHVLALIIKVLQDTNVITYENVRNLELKIKMKEDYLDSLLFNVTIYVKGKNIKKIDNISDLVNTIFNKNSIFNIKDFKEKDKNILRFLKSNGFKITGNKTRELLELCTLKEIDFTVNSLEYLCKIKKENIPLKFTLKGENNKIKLQCLKSNVIQLNKEGNAFLFNKEIYIPHIKECKIYKDLFTILNSKSYTYIKESSLKKIIKLLKIIGNVNIYKDVKNILERQEDIYLFFYKRDNNIFCKFNINHDIKGSDKYKAILEILYKNKFTKKGDELLFCGNDKELFRILKSDICNLCKIEADESFGDFRIIQSNEIKIDLKDFPLGYKVNININDNINMEINKLLNAYNNGDCFYKFSNNSFIDFSNNKISKVMEFIKLAYTYDNFVIPKGYEEFLKYECKYINILNSDILGKVNEKNEDIKAPKGLKAKLQPHQLEALRWMENKRRLGLFGIVADEMGLGKTIEAISYLLLNKGDLSIVITKTSLVYNWKDEFLKFAPDLKVAVIHGNVKKRVELLSKCNNYDVLLTSYNTLSNDINYYENITFDNLIIDESQTIKNSKTIVSKNVKKIKAKIKFALSGTPIENNLTELWNIFDFLKEGYLFTESEFKKRFMNSNKDAFNELRLMVKPFILRRLKKDVLHNLKDKNEKILYVDMTKEQRNFYNMQLKSYTSEITEESDTLTTLSFITKLRQIAIDPYLVDNNYNGESGKVNKAIKLIKNSIDENKKILVFSQFTSLLDRLIIKLNKYNIKFFYLDGSTKSKDRVNLCNEFNISNDIFVFLISLKAGGTGLNLISAERIIHFDPWWNKALENQATDRAHRIGQKNELEVIKLVSKNSIEEKMIKIKEEKENIIGEVLKEGSFSDYSNKLTKDEMKYLLSIN